MQHILAKKYITYFYIYLKQNNGMSLLNYYNNNKNI